MASNTLFIYLGSLLLVVIVMMVLEYLTLRSWNKSLEAYHKSLSECHLRQNDRSAVYHNASSKQMAALQTIRAAEAGGPSAGLLHGDWALIKDARDG